MAWIYHQINKLSKMLILQICYIDIYILPVVSSAQIRSYCEDTDLELFLSIFFYDVSVKMTMETSA